MRRKFEIPKITVNKFNKENIITSSATTEYVDGLKDIPISNRTQVDFKDMIKKVEIIP